jgi:DNA modification methylase
MTSAVLGRIEIGGVTILVGDVFDRLAELPADSVDCVVTSPPYWGLRDYGVAGQIGLEPTLGEHLDVMVRVFREVWRVLKPSGSLWLNYGDCYATVPNGRSADDTKAAGSDDRTFRDKPFSTVGPIHPPESGNPYPAGVGRRGGGNAPCGLLKPKDLCMIPNRLAIALQDDGWWVRSEIIWGKPNAMPDSSGIYRPAVAHEKIYLLTKSDEPAFWVARDTHEISATPDLSERVALRTNAEKMGARWIGLGSYYNAEAVRVGRASDEDAATYRGGSYVASQPSHRAVTGNKRVDKQRGHSRRHQGFNDRWDAMERSEQGGNGRLLRNYEPAPLPVWEMATVAYSDGHFATFPPALVERCLRAGCPAGGVVLDPFGGAGTTGLVANRLGRRAILIELNPDYAEMARARIAEEAMGPATAAASRAVRRGTTDAGPLFGATEEVEAAE